jgi:hypothetical protein
VAATVEEADRALAREQLALCSLTLDGALAAGVKRLLTQLLELLELRPGRLLVGRGHARGA